MRLLAAPVLLLVLVPATANAATARTREHCGPRGDCTRSAEFAADPGEVNRLTITEPEPGVFEFRDESALVRAEAGCVAVDERAARCAAASAYAVIAGRLRARSTFDP